MAKKSTNNGAGTLDVVLASASAVRRAGLEAIVNSAPQLRLKASLQGTQTAPQRALDAHADALLADLENESSLPDQSLAATPTILLIDNPSVAWAARVIRSGAKAILARDSGREEIVPAIMAAYSGHVLLDSAVALNIAGQVRAERTESRHESLTPRELEVLSMLAEGLGNREIASRLGISDHTIKFHISSILDKLGAESRTEAVTMGLRMGLILL